MIVWDVQDRAPVTMPRSEAEFHRMPNYLQARYLRALATRQAMQRLVELARDGA